MSDYGHIELSAPEFEPDNLRFLTFQSPTLGRRGDVTLFVPSNAENLQNLPLVLLLHGVYGSHWAWTMKGGAHQTAQNLIDQNKIAPVVIAMPSDGLFGDGSGYFRHAAGDFEKWIVEDVVGCATEVLPFVGANSKLFIAGLSMGGYGALRIGAKYAEQFAGVSAHSAMTKASQLTNFTNADLTICGDLNREDLDVLFWIKNRNSLPPIRFDCGADDDLLEANRELHRVLQAESIRHNYFEFGGGHNWDYWQSHIADTLIFFDTVD